MMKPFWKRSRQQRVRDHITQLGREYARRGIESSGEQNDTIVYETALPPEPALPGAEERAAASANARADRVIDNAVSAEYKSIRKQTEKSIRKMGKEAAIQRAIDIAVSGEGQYVDGDLVSMHSSAMLDLVFEKYGNDPHFKRALERLEAEETESDAIIEEDHYTEDGTEDYYPEDETDEEEDFDDCSENAYTDESGDFDGYYPEDFDDEDTDDFFF